MTGPVLGGGSITILGIGIPGAIKRYEIFINLQPRTYIIKKGYFPSIRTLRGFLTDLRSLIIESREDFGAADRTILIWRISLDFKNAGEPISIVEHPVKKEAYRKLESLANKLNVPIHDKTKATNAGASQDLPVVPRRPLRGM